MADRKYLVRTAAHPRLWLADLGFSPIKRLARRFETFDAAASAAARRRGTLIVESVTS